MTLGNASKHVILGKLLWRTLAVSNELTNSTEYGTGKVHDHLSQDLHIDLLPSLRIGDGTASSTGIMDHRFLNG